jgi:hypothetical protein
MESKMGHRDKLRPAAVRGTLRVVALAAAATLSTAWSAEVAYDITVCTHGRTAMLESNPEITAFGVESWGIVTNASVPQWEKATTHCVGYTRVVNGKGSGKGVCKWVFANGDTGVGEWEIPAVGEPAWTWLMGSAGMKGVQGGGTFRTVFSGKPAEAGTSQGCRRDWGKYTLP